jgi:putative membrane protein insertion efficiency factor
MKRASHLCPDCAGALLRLPRNAGRGMIWLYRHTLSPLVGYNCRHLPTCSVYADEAIERFGLWGGGWMTLARLLRCQPWGTSGIDNVPATRPAGARWYLPWRYGNWRGVNRVPASPTPSPSSEPSAAPRAED